MVKDQIIQNYKKVNNVFSEILEDHLMYNNCFWFQLRNNDLASYNVYSGKPFGILNQVLLDYQCGMKKFAFNRWLTLKQARQLGAVLKEENREASFIVHQRNRFYHKKDNIDITGLVKYMKRNGKSNPGFQYMNVNELFIYDIYNVSQFNGLAGYYFSPGVTGKKDEREQESLIREFVFHSGPIVHESSRFDYKSYDDHLIIKPRRDFDFSHNYCKHIIFRLAEWAKPKTLGKNYEIPGLYYGLFDALIDELFSVLFYHHLNLEAPILKNSGFVTEWIKGIFNNDRLIVKSIAYAYELFNFVRSSYSRRMKCNTLQLLKN